MPQSARLSAGGGVQSQFGQCPNRSGNISVGASLSVHDEFFYLNNINPNGPPTNRRTFNGSTADYYMTLTMTEHFKLNLARDPCRQDFNYSFILCVRESLSSQVGYYPNLLLQVQNCIVKIVMFNSTHV